MGGSKIRKKCLRNIWTVPNFFKICFYFLNDSIILGCSDLDEDSGHGSAGTVSPTASSGVPVRERSGSIGSSSGGWIVLDKTNPDQSETGSKKGNLIAYDPAAIAQQKQIILHDSLVIFFLQKYSSLRFLKIFQITMISSLQFLTGFCKKKLS